MKIVSIILFFSTLIIAAENAAFTVSGSPLPDPAKIAEPGKTTEPVKAQPLSIDNPEVQNELINQLKQKAVVQWLQNYLGQRFSAYEKSVAPDFGEKYVTDYKVAKVAGQANTLELTGHIDSDGLRKWVRVSETKEKGSEAIRPVFIFSANARNLQSSPRETLDRTKDWPLAQMIYKDLTTHFQKVNTKLSALDVRLGLASAPTYENDISNLSTELSSTHNTVLWVHLSQCNSCTNARLDLYAYSLSPGRLVLIKSDELNSGASALSSADKVKGLIAPFIASLHEGVEELISEGKLFSKELTLRIEGIDAYKSYKSVERDLQKLDYLGQPSIKLIEAAVAEFNVTSNLSTEELAQRIQGNTWSGFKLQAMRVDSNTIVMRYLH